LKSEICHLQSSEAWRAASEREAWLEAVTNDPLLPGRILPSDYLGQPAWRRRVEVLRDASRQLRTFHRP
jgi:DNA-binding transcriptional regulator PaaX